MVDYVSEVYPLATIFSVYRDTSSYGKLKKKKIGTRNFITCDSVAFRILLLAGSLGSRSGTAFEPYPIRFVTSYQAEDRNKESWRVMVMSIRDLTTVVSVQ